MEVVKKTNRYTIFKKRNGRYGVRSAGGAWINGEDKVKILSDEGLIKAPTPGKPESSDDEGSSEDQAEESSEETEDSKSDKQEQATQ